MTREALHARLRAAGIPVALPMTAEERADWEEQLAQAKVANDEFYAGRGVPPPADPGR